MGRYSHINLDSVGMPDPGGAMPVPDAPAPTGGNRYSHITLDSVDGGEAAPPAQAQDTGVTDEERKRFHEATGANRYMEQAISDVALYGANQQYGKAALGAVRAGLWAIPRALSYPAEATTRAAGFLTSAALDPEKGFNRETWETQQPGVANVLRPVMRAVAGKEGAVFQPEGYADAALNTVGLAADMFADPVNLLKFGKLTELGKVNARVRAALAAGKGGGRYLDEAGWLYRDVPTAAGGVEKRAERVSDFLEELARTEANPQAAARTRDLAKWAADRQNLKLIDPTNLTELGRSEAGLTTAMLRGGRLGVELPGLGRAQSALMNPVRALRGQRTVGGYKAGQRDYMKFLGESVQMENKLRKAFETQHGDTLAEAADDLKRHVDAGGNVDDWLTGVMRAGERPHQIADPDALPLESSLMPGDERIALRMRAADLSETGATPAQVRLAGAIQDFYRGINEAEDLAGVGASLQYRLKPEAEKRLLDWAAEKNIKPEEAKAGFYNLVARYGDSERFKAAQGWMQHEAFASPPGARPDTPPAPTWTDSPFDPKSERAYMARRISPEFKTTATDVEKYLTTKFGGTDGPHAELVQTLRKMMSRTPGGSVKATSTTGLSATQRGELGSSMDTAALQDELKAGLVRMGVPLNPKIPRFYDRALDWIRPKDAALAHKLQRLGADAGVLDSDVLRTMETRAQESVRMRASKSLADRIVADGTFSVSKPQGDITDYRQLPLGRSEWFQRGADGIYRPKVSMQEVFPGLGDAYKDVALEPDYGKYLATVGDRMTGPAFMQLHNDYMNWLRPMLLMRPKTAVRNAVDTANRNLVHYGAGAVSATAEAGRIAARFAPETDPYLRKGGWVGENIVGGMPKLMRKLAGKPLPDGIVTDTGESIADAQLWQEMQDGFITGRGRSGSWLEGADDQGLGTEIRTRLEAKTKGGLAKALGAPRRGVEAWKRHTLDPQAAADNFGRMVAYIAERKAGYAPMEAAARAHAVQWTAATPDWIPAALEKASDGRVSAGLTRWMTSNVFTFWNFTRKNIPHWARETFRRPVGMTVPEKLKNAMQSPGGLPFLGGAAEPPPELQTRNTRTGRLFMGAGEDEQGRPYYEYADPSNFLSQYQLLGGEFAAENMATPTVRSLVPISGVEGTVWEPLLQGSTTNPYTGTTMHGAGEQAMEWAGRAVPPISWLRRTLQAAGRGPEGEPNAFGQHVTEPLVGTVGQRDEHPLEAVAQTLFNPLTTRREGLGPTLGGYPGSDIAKNRRQYQKELDRLEAKEERGKELTQEEQARLETLDYTLSGVPAEEWLDAMRRQAAERAAARGR